MKTSFLKGGVLAVLVLSALAVSACHEPYSFEGESADYGDLAARNDKTLTNSGTISVSTVRGMVYNLEEHQYTVYNLAEQQFTVSFNVPSGAAIDPATVKDAIKVYLTKVGEDGKLRERGAEVSCTVISVNGNTVTLEGNFTGATAIADTATSASTDISSSVEVFVDATKLRAKSTSGVYYLNGDGDKIAGEAEDSVYNYDLTVTAKPTDRLADKSIPSPAVGRVPYDPCFALEVGISAPENSTSTGTVNVYTYGLTTVTVDMLKSILTFEYFNSASTTWTKYDALIAGTGIDGYYDFTVNPPPAAAWANNAHHVFVRVRANMSSPSLPAAFQGMPVGLSVGGRTSYQNTAKEDYIALEPALVSAAIDATYSLSSFPFSTPTGIRENNQVRKIAISVGSSFYVDTSTLTPANFAVVRVIGNAAEIITPEKVEFETPVPGDPANSSTYDHSYLKGRITLTLPGSYYLDGSGHSYYVGIQGVKVWSNGTSSATASFYYNDQAPGLQGFTTTTSSGEVTAYLPDIKYYRYVWSDAITNLD